MDTVKFSGTIVSGIYKPLRMLYGHGVAIAVSIELYKFADGEVRRLPVPGHETVKCYGHAMPGVDGRRGYTVEFFS